MSAITGPGPGSGRVARTRSEEHGVHALAHLGPGVEQRHRAVGFRPQDRPAVLGQAVADPVFLTAQPMPA